MTAAPGHKWVKAPRSLLAAFVCRVCGCDSMVKHYGRCSGGADRPAAIEDGALTEPEQASQETGGGSAPAADRGESQATSSGSVSASAASVGRAFMSFMERTWLDLMDGIEAALAGLLVALVLAWVLAIACIPIALVVLAFWAVAK